jgi:opacity protein-like surface antigen
MTQIKLQPGVDDTGASRVIGGNGGTENRAAKRREKMKRLVVTLIAFMVMLPVTAVMAKNPRYERDWYGWNDYNNDNYASVRIGAFIPNDEADVLDKGFAAGAALGHKLNRNFAFEIGLDYMSADFNHDYGYEDAYLSTFGIPVTAKFIVPLSHQVEFYAGGGFGVYFTHVEFDHEYYDGYRDDDNGVDDTGLGFHALVGADFKMNPNMALTMELKYTEIEEDFAYPPYDDLELEGTTASAGIKFLF